MQQKEQRNFWMTMKKYISLSITGNHGKIANFTSVMDEDVYGKKSYKEMYDEMMGNITVDTLELAFEDGVFAFKKSFGNQEDRKRLKGEA